MNVTRVSFTGLVIGLVLVVWVGVGVTGAVKAWGPVQQAEGARVEALIGEEVRHLAEMNRAAESEAWAVASAQAAAGQAWANAWRKVWVAGGWVAVAGLLVGLWVVGLKKKAEVEKFREVKQKEADAPAWVPAGVHLLTATVGGQAWLMCEITGAVARLGDGGSMRALVAARRDLAANILLASVQARRDVEIAQALKEKLVPGRVEVLQ